MAESGADVRPAHTEQQVRDLVLAVIRELAPGSPADITGPDAELVADLGYHSLALLELAFALEDEFDLEPIDEETARQITTVGLVQDTVVSRLAERGGLAGPVESRAGGE